ncbi:MAG TPA: hypothetical protein VGI34_08685 [Candidatus Acidoferrales bacterium]
MFRLADKSATNGVNFQLRILIPALVFFGISLVAMPVRAQLNSNIANVNLNAIMSTSLTVSPAPGLVNFALPPSGTATGSSVITVVTTWTLRPSVGAVTTYGYFTSASAALTDGAGDNIPSSSVSGSINGGAFGAFTGASPFAAASSVTLSSTRILGNNRSSNHTDTLNLKISTVGLALPAATYTGVLNIQAQAL